MVHKYHIQIHLSVEMQFFVFAIMALALTINLTLNSVVTTACFKSELSTDLFARATALREALLIRDGIFPLSNANQLNINDLTYLIESLAIDLN